MMDDQEHQNQIVQIAEQWLGTPYRHQGTLKGVGCDCLGLVRGIWRELYGSEPEEAGPYTMDWAEGSGEERMMDAAHRHFIPTQEMLSGTLLVFRWREGTPAKHLGIYTSGERFIHAYERSAVISSPLVPQWRKRIAGMFHFPKVMRG